MTTAQKDIAAATNEGRAKSILLTKLTEYGASERAAGQVEGIEMEKKMMEADLRDVIVYFEEHKEFGKATRLRAILPRPVNEGYLSRLLKTECKKETHAAGREEAIREAVDLSKEFEFQAKTGCDACLHNAEELGNFSKALISLQKISQEEK